MRKTLKAVVISLFFFLFLLSASVFALDIDPAEIYDAPGLHPHRETLSSIPNEHIDPFTGGLILSFEDIRLPGNGGLDLVIQRTYNSKNTCNYFETFNGHTSCAQMEEYKNLLGPGWTLHFGRLFVSVNVNFPHVIEMPDGSRHTAYRRIDLPSKYITKDYWLLDLGGTDPVLTMTNGTKIYFGRDGLNHPDFPVTPYTAPKYATKIEDVNGNHIDIYYKNYQNAFGVDYVIDSLGRTIEFNTSIIYGTVYERLTSITGPGVIITYDHQSLPAGGQTLLVEARPPIGDPWRYAYDESTFELTRLTTPAGGIINYTMGFIGVDMGFPFTYRGVIQKVTGGAVPAGTWTIRFSQGPQNDYTEITDPCGRVHKYKYHGYGEGLPWGSMWKIGLPKSREIVGEETVVYGWTNSAAISYEDYVVPYVGRDFDIYVPLLTQKAITRDGKTYVTNYSNYDSYANPQTISETGDKTRNRSISYWYNTSKNIVQNKPLSETVTGGAGSFPGTFATNYTYDDYTTNNGLLLQINRYGVVTNYTYYQGNLWTKTDANGNTSTYQWTNGRVSKITNPIYNISRVINQNGTIASETNGRGFTTSYTYDGNLRLTGIAPPGVNPTTFSYPANNSYRQETRGGYSITHYNDGFGRLTGSSDTKGITTTIAYKSCGPKNYSASNIGDTVYYDNFGRVTQITHKDNSRITYQYSQSNVIMNDESLRNTTFTYNAFGTPGEKWLVGVTDQLGNVSSYNYNILGSLTSITQGNLTRGFSYNSKNFLTSETHPEKGTIAYGRDNVGNMTSKSDSLGATSYTYDPINRLRTVNYSAGTVTFNYDNADNRITMSNPTAEAVYTFDSANRLTKKTETIIGRTYYTDYRYDGNDNLIDIYYPPLGYSSGRRIQYTYNSYNQVTSIPGFVTNVNYYTTGTSIGLPSGITYSNNRVTSLTYNNRNLTTQINAGTALHMGYGYVDTRGNMTSITNNLDSSKNQTFTYDELNRLKTFNGLWGTGSFTYNSTGNRLTKTVAGVATNYAYASNRLTSTSGGESFSFTYNNDGDAIGINGYTLQYDKLHNLLSYRQGANSIADFTYDGDGMRVKKTAGGKTTVYHYDQEGRVLSEDDGNGNLIADYIYLHGKLAAKIVNDAAPPTGSIVINGGGVSTHTAYVTLTLSASDPQSGVSQMRFSNDGTNWSDWETYASTKQWTLTPGNGGRTVYVQYRDSAGNISTYTSNITLLLHKELVDFDGDRKTDITVYRSNTGYWYIIPSLPPGTPYGYPWGGDPTDIPVPGDYDGDGKTDIAVWRPGDGYWYILRSSDGGVTQTQWGIGFLNDVPVPGDYDGDGKSDIAVYHSTSGLWFIKKSSDGSSYYVGYGGTGYDPVLGDFDADGKTDIAVYHSASGLWFIKKSSDGTSYYVGYGGTGYVPVPGDFDGDGKTDIAVYHSASGLWFIKPSSGAADYYVGYGGSGYVPGPGDYDGDGKTDIAVYHSASGLWFIKKSSDGTSYYVGWGGDPSDIPVTTNRASY